jgi:protoheme IX farnesyltransferase
MPPLIGWAAASGKLPSQAWLLYAVLFLWQFPHFMAIAWMYREDYARAGYLVLPPDSDSRTSWVDLQTLLPLLILVLLNVFVALTSDSDATYLIGALLLSAGFLYYGVQFVLRRSNSSARRLLAASIIYLPSLFVLMILSRG